MSTLTDLRGRIDHARKELHDVFEEAGPKFDMDQVKSIEGDSAAKAAWIRQKNEELNDLCKEREGLEEFQAIKDRTDELGKAGRHPGHDNPDAGRENGSGGGDRRVKTLGELFIESESVKAWREGRPGQSASLDVPDRGFDPAETKATFTTGGSGLGVTAVQDLPGLQLLGQQRLTVAGLLASGTTTREAIRYVEETTFTNAATTVTEGSAKPEASWATDVVTENVTKIAVISKVTDELFNDFPMLRDYIDSRMRFMVAQTEETQLVSGNGTAPNLRGILNRSGIQTQAKGTDPTPDAVYKAMTKVRTGPFVEPDGAVFHPNDWQDVKLLRTADGIYIWGSPADGGPDRIWGLPVVVTTAITENTGLVGAFGLGGQVWRRQGIQVDATNSNEDDFKKNLIALRAEERLALAVYIPSAFCKVTGI